jgi:molybdopterin converting factor small subunit
MVVYETFIRCVAPEIPIARIHKSYYRWRMHVKVKLFATYREYLPPDSKRGAAELEVAAGDTAVSLLKQLGVPVDGESVILINGRSPEPGQCLRNGDIIAAFPAIAGG